MWAVERGRVQLSLAWRSGLVWSGFLSTGGAMQRWAVTTGTVTGGPKSCIVCRLYYGKLICALTGLGSARV